MDRNDSERLVRVEEMLKHLLSRHEEDRDSQEKKNELFFKARADVEVLKTKSQFGWQIICAIGALTAALSSAVAWAVSAFSNRGPH